MTEEAQNEKINSLSSLQSTDMNIVNEYGGLTNSGFVHMSQLKKIGCFCMKTFITPRKTIMERRS